MDREFLDFYNQELLALKERAAAFAEEYPGIADRLGGIVGEQADPMVTGLLQGAAFLAARVQLKLKHEFPEFTQNLLEQLLPNYLAPTPSVLLVRVTPPFEDPSLQAGIRIARGAYLDAAVRVRDGDTVCRYRLTSDVTLWPIDVAQAEYLASPAAFQALGVNVGSEVAGGLRLSLAYRGAGSKTGAPAGTGKAAHLAGCAIADLPVFLLADEGDAAALYEQLFADCSGVYFRYVDNGGRSVVIPAPEGCLSQIGFSRDEALLPKDRRIFEGFDIIREYFQFPRKFLGFRLEKLETAFPRIEASTVDVLFTFREVNARLQSAVRPDMFGLYVAPAINLFEKTADRIVVKPGQHEYHLVPDRSHYLDYEPFLILSVHAHYPGGSERTPVPPLYSARAGSMQDSNVHYTMRRVPRRRSARERQQGGESRYAGTDVFISLSQVANDDRGSVAELSVRTLCSNRHLPDYLPTGKGSDFRFIDNVTLKVTGVHGPTPLQEPVVSQQRNRTEVLSAGTVAWRLINMLNLNYLSLSEADGPDSGRALRDMLLLLSGSPDRIAERRIRGIRTVSSRPVVRRVKQREGIGVARGIEVSVTIDEKAFAGSGGFLLGAVLERFFADYASMNHFTQTVIRSPERGEIMRWPARAGAKRRL